MLFDLTVTGSGRESLDPEGGASATRRSASRWSLAHLGGLAGRSEQQRSAVGHVGPVVRAVRKLCQDTCLDSMIDECGSDLTRCSSSCQRPSSRWPETLWQNGSGSGTQTARPYVKSTGTSRPTQGLGGGRPACGPRVSFTSLHPRVSPLPKNYALGQSITNVIQGTASANDIPVASEHDPRNFQNQSWLRGSSVVDAGPQVTEDLLQV